MAHCQMYFDETDMRPTSTLLSLHAFRMQEPYLISNHNLPQNIDDMIYGYPISYKYL